jgi:hypothetical protein
VVRDGSGMDGTESLWAHVAVTRLMSRVGLPMMAAKIWACRLCDEVFVIVGLENGKKWWQNRRDHYGSK